MAFNPFHAFRKHQKPLIAALAIFCMVLFVVQIGFGRADPVNQVLSLFGAGRGRGAVVATLYGKKVTEGDLAKLRRDRDLASNFLMYVARASAMQKISKLLEQVQQSRENRDPQQQLSPEITQYLGLWAQIYQGQFQLPRSQRYEFARQFLQRILVQRQLQSLNNPTGANSMDELARVFAFEVWANDPRRPAKEYYFGGTADTTDLLDFVLWEQQADRLGVVLTESDVIAAVNHEGADQNIVTPPRLAGDRFVEIVLRDMRDVRNASPDQLAQALNREFRRLMAQEAVLGAEGGVRSVREGVVPQMPAAGTPREFLEWFRNQRTTIKVAVLPVPVQRFVDQVKDTPPESTLKALYEQYKADEPEPSRALPGFKEPRRVRVETVSARSDSDFYQNAARAKALTAPAARLTAPVAAGLFGGPLVGAASAVWPLAFDPVQREYEFYAGDVRSWVERSGVGTDLGERRPVYAGAVGLAVGATPGSLLSAGTAVAATNSYYDVRLARLAGSLVGAGAAGQPLAGIGLPLPYLTSVQPQRVVEPKLLARVVDGLAAKLVTQNLDTVATELGKLKNRPDEAKAYVAKAVKEYGLTHYEMAQAKTSYGLENDPALKPLRDELATEERERGLADPNGPPPDVARVVLNGVGVYDPQRFPPGQWTVVKEPLLWWRAEDFPARERPYEVVRGQVEAAWRFEKARSLARAEAERVEAAVKKNVAANNSAAEAAKVLRSFGTEFELDNVARLLMESTPRADIGQPYRPYTFPYDRIPYPRADLLDRLMAMKTPGDAVVVRDKPAATFYVAVLQERDDPTRKGGNPDLKGFLTEYANATNRQSLWQQYFMPDVRRDYARALLKQMRSEATGGKVDEDGNYVLPADVARFSEAESSD
jgi:hypothetical protein